MKKLMDNGGISLEKNTLIYVEKKFIGDFIAIYLSDNNYPAISIHSDRTKRQRRETLWLVRTGKFKILVTTAVRLPRYVIYFFFFYS